MTASLKDSDEIVRAEALVAEQREQLKRSLSRASRSGEKLAQTLTSELKPALTAAIVVVGAAAVVGLSVAMARRSGRRGWRAPAEPTLLGNAAKAAALWAARLLARRVAQEVVARFGEPTSTASVPSAPDQVES
ncbi:MAG TPA: hypothetical protein VEQ59_18045 [Polyangiaceae bacterium]|nr:hypothetical protein [Polyangiaceae bacterium]